jgi:hypothetical protein
MAIKIPGKCSDVCLQAKRDSIMASGGLPARPMEGRPTFCCGAGLLCLNNPILPHFDKPGNEKLNWDRRDRR